MLFLGILAVFVCLYESVSGWWDVVVFVFVACKHKNLVLTFSHCVFLSCFNFFFTTIELFSDLAFLLLCFLLRWPGRFLELFARFVYFFLPPFTLNAIHYHCAFLLRCYCRFCCRAGPVGRVAFFSWRPSVVIRVQQCPPCVLSCPVLSTFFFLLFKNTRTHPINPHAPTENLFTSTNMIMSVVVFVRVFAWLLATLRVSVWLWLRLLVGLHLFFVFI